MMSSPRFHSVAFCLISLSAAALLAAQASAADSHSHSSGLIVLGDEEYHARASIDEPHQVFTVTLFDKSGKKSVSVPSPAIVVNLRVNGAPRQFLMKPVSMAVDPAGESSRFVLQSAELLELLRKPGTASHFRVTIQDKSYAGKLNFSGKSP